MSAEHRYGVFLRPDARTCAAITTVTGLLRAQYGLVSAGAFPPHQTLVGSLPLAVPEQRLVEVLEATLAGCPSVPLQNAGVHRLGPWAVVYDVSRLDGAVNAPLVALAARVDEVVRPFLDPDRPGLPADLVDPSTWRGHLSLATHDLADRPDLVAEVEAFVRELDVGFPVSSVADTVTLYRFRHPCWTGAWWQDLRWEHVRSFTLGPGFPGA